MNREIQKFSSRFFSFIFYYVLAALFTIIIFYKSGEIFWLNKTLDAQVNDRRNFIYGAAYSNLPHYFKFAATKNISPDILVIGSSRVMQFRSSFFSDSIPFYNAGGVFSRLTQIRSFLESLPSSRLPGVIIIGLDQWWFSAQYDYLTKTPNDLIYHQYSWLNNWEALSKWQQFYFDCWSGKISWNHWCLKKSNNTEWYGLAALIEQSGIRKDGSREYGDKLNNRLSVKDSFQQKPNNELSGVALFNFLETIDKNAIDELRLLLLFCKINNISVSGFLPPVHDDLLIQFEKQLKNYTCFFHLQESLNPVFRENGFRIYDFTRLKSYGSNNDEMIDALHAGEKSALKLYLQLLRTDTYLNQYSDSTYLKLKLDSANGNFILFGNY